jgi:rhodanese-related sulfurtransferase
MIPEIDVQALADRLRSPDKFVLLDVREAWELQSAKITDARLEVAPMSRLANEGLEALPESARDPQAEIYVICHTGMRSAEVTGWLASQGWTDVHSVRGGIDAFARRIDGSVGFY